MDTPPPSSSSQLQPPPLSGYLKMINNWNENAPLLSATPLGQYLNRIPLDRLQPSELMQLHLALNVEQLIGTKSGLARDYRGLAELMGYGSLELEARFKRAYNPTKCLVDAYRTPANGQVVSVTDLLKLIEKLERFDVLDDLLPTLVRLAASARPHDHANIKELQVVDQNRSNPLVATENDTAREQDVEPLHHLHRSHKYDAFLCYAPEDSDHAQQLMRLLESHNKRIVTVDNLLAGQFEYDALVQMIAVECRKVIIVLTPNFLASRDCDFQAKFANEIAIKSGWFPKIIPVLCEPLDDSLLPPLIRITSKINMTRANQRDWQLRKLVESLDFSPDQTTGRMTRHLASSPLPEVRLTSCATLEGSPIVELAQSQSSSANNSSCQLIVDAIFSQPLGTPSSDTGICSPIPEVSSTPVGLQQTSTWRNFYRSLARRLRHHPNSASSRSILLPSSASNLDTGHLSTSECHDARSQSRWQ